VVGATLQIEMGVVQNKLILAPHNLTVLNRCNLDGLDVLSTHAPDQVALHAARCQRAILTRLWPVPLQVRLHLDLNSDTFAFLHSLHVVL